MLAGAIAIVMSVFSMATRYSNCVCSKQITIATVVGFHIKTCLTTCVIRREVSVCWWFVIATWAHESRGPFPSGDLSAVE